jgi:phosphoserine phosphatase RsbU/P
VKAQTLSFSISDPKRIYPTLTRLLRGGSGRFKLPFHLQSDWFLCLFEAIQNAFQHGEARRKKEAVRVKLRLSPRWLETRVYDRGPGFDLRTVKRKGMSWDERGRGISILSQLTDSVAYRRGRGGNCLTLKKRILRPEARYKITDLLGEMSRRLSEAPNLQKVYETILDKLIEIFNVERASIMIYYPEEATLKVAAARGIAPSVLKKIRVKRGEGISGYVFARSRPLLIDDVKKNLKLLPKGPSRKSYRSRSFISAPLISSPDRVGEEKLGVINLTDKLDGSSFSRSELRLLSAIAQQAAAYVKIGSLIERLKEAESLRRDLEVVREIQHKLLPSRVVPPPGVEIAGDFLISKKGGGDYFDVLRVGEDAYLVVADVSGHHLPSALSMVNFRSAFRALALHRPSPRELLDSLNEMMFEDLIHAEHFICVSLVRLKPREKTLFFAGAGSLPLFLSGRKDFPLRTVSAQGTPLGVERGIPYEEVEIPLPSGEGLFMATDGAVELPLKSGGLLGLEGFQGLLSRYAALAPSLQVRRIKAALQRRTPGRMPPDDVTLLAAKMV